jgi:hypothetical protein
MTSELPQTFGALNVTRYGEGNNLCFTVHSGGVVVLTCRGFVLPEYRERAIQTHLRRLRGEPPILSESKSINEATRAILSLWGAVAQPEMRSAA